MKLFALCIFAGCLFSQEFTISIKDASGKVESQSIVGVPVVAGLEVLEKFRLSQCESRVADGEVCPKLKYASLSALIRNIIVDKIVELSDTYPTSATASIRAARDKAEADLEAARKALELAAKGSNN